ncbi:SH3 domain-containing protein [Coxiella-like endosymbiont of Rhipicephalus sanguineus]|uniref:SH3 domain-containing protein n=1 Tax=Coxiella-like endosymbiont of Rhipicephalus sanguineus TaxID=1955402 RepID=UPI0020411407|nr:SH3 domain-containing protein [Coxiella-like endosymbiont of Rhipicephalus sanguineus]MBT8506662.1 SH3 domain-containing protein [Coxiella-like endosymbiont of Rhipicephalus sanguineus]
MRKLIITLGLSFCLSILDVSYAVLQQQCSANLKKSEFINLYQSPELKSTVLQKVSPDDELIPIYQKKDWIKVGDLRNGKVGWINREQYRKVFESYYQPDIQTMFIRTEHNYKWKPVINVMAYKNGKKLSDEEAKKLYQRIEKQRAEEARYMQQTFWRVNHLMVEQMREMNQLMDPLSEPLSEDLLGFEPAVIQPVIILGPSQVLQSSSTPSPSTKKDKK